MGDKENLIEKANELKNKERFEESLKILEDLYRDFPNSEDIKKELIDTLFSYGGYLNDEYILEYEKARNIFKKTIEIDPNNYRAHYNLGIAYFNLGEMKKAKNAYKMAIKIKPDYKHCHYNIGLIYETKGDFKHALNHYEKALKIDPNFTYALHARNQIRKLIDELKNTSED